ncbi:antitoxin [Kineococcus sp. SYSU DK003]|uniref:antitoxin n=1 Tax=Kineococcus sp. SYSU DK003 TaxID=3383124 RepID=UPI003D7D412F
MNYLKGKLGEAAEQAREIADQARGRAGTLAAEHSGKAEGAIGKASDFVNSRTQGKYADKVTRVGDLARKGVDKAAEQAPPTTMPQGGTPMRGGTTTDGTPMTGPVR